MYQQFYFSRQSPARAAKVIFKTRAKLPGWVKSPRNVKLYLNLGKIKSEPAKFCDQMNLSSIDRQIKKPSLIPLSTVGGRGCGPWLSSKSRNSRIHATNGNVREGIFIYQNIPGIYKRIASISAHIDILVEKYKPHVLFISELPEDRVAQCCPTGYHHVKGTLKNSTKPVRVSAIVKNGVEYKEVKLKAEIPTCVLKIDSWTITGAYREWAKEGVPETRGIQKELQRFENFAEKWTRLRGKNVVMGDFNMELMPDEDDEHQKELEPIRQVVEDSILAAGWVQLITDPTRRKKSHEKESSVLDHVYTTHVSHTEEVVNCNEIDTDHNLIGLKLRTDREVFTPRSFLYRNITAIDPATFDLMLQESCLDRFWKSTDVNEALEILEFKIMWVLNKLAPVRKITTTENHAPWHNDELKSMVERKREMRRLLMRIDSIVDKVEYAAYKKEVREAVVKAKKKWTEDFLNISDTSKRWARGKEMSGMEKKEKETEIKIQIDGKIEDKPEIVAPAMNEGFKEKVRLLQQKVKVDLPTVEDYVKRYMKTREMAPKEVKEGSFTCVTIKEVRQTIMSLQNTGATGRDGISTTVLKRFAFTLAPMIRRVINMSITQCRYPRAWKEGHITPLPKSGDLLQLKNWRPIVINCSVSKVLEKILNKQMNMFLEDEKIYSVSQHAYRAGRSCSTAHQDADTIINSMRNQGRISVILMTDMSAAFNVIKADVLLLKMKHYGFDRWTRKLIEDYLSGRCTRTKIGNYLSEAVTLNSGVGEGSVLGPAIFAMGLCDVGLVAADTVKICGELGLDVLAETVEFADDVTGLIGAYTEEDMQVAINVMFEQFKKYFSANGLVLNDNKCSILVGRPGAKVKELQLGDKKEESWVKLLGLYIDEGFTFNTHLRRTKSAVFFKLSCIKKISEYLTKENLKRMVEAVVITKIGYCGEVYIGKTLENQKQVQRMINPAARLVMGWKGKDQDYPTAKLMADTGWFNSTCMWVEQQVHSMWRCLYQAGAYKTHQAIMRSHTEQTTRSPSLKIIWKKLNNKHARSAFAITGARWINEFRLIGRAYVDENGRKTEKEMFKIAVENAIRAKVASGSLSNGTVEQYRFQNEE